MYDIVPYGWMDNSVFQVSCML